MSRHLHQRLMLSGACAAAGLLLAALVLCAGCGGEGATVGKASGNVFPNDLTQYPGAKPTGPDEKTVVELRTPDDLKKVTDFYQDKGKNGGWDATRTIPKGPSMTTIILNKEARRCTVNANVEKDKNGAPETTIQVASH